MTYKVVKFSYLCMNPAFVTIWNKFRPSGDVFLVMHRNAEHVVWSKARAFNRFIHDSNLLPRSFESVRYNFEASVMQLTKYRHQVWMLPFPECLDDLNMVNEALDTLIGTTIPEDIWNKVVDKSLVHF